MLTQEQEKRVEVAYERYRWAAKEAERLFDMPLVVRYSGGKDSDVILQLAKESGGRRWATRCFLRGRRSRVWKMCWARGVRGG